MLLLVLLVLLSSLAHSPATNTISPGQALTAVDRIVSNNGRYALGFIQTGSKSSDDTLHWYLGMWFNNLPKLTVLWVANGDNPIANANLCELKITLDGNLVIANQGTKSIIWSARANATTSNTIARLSNRGNLILHNSLNTSDVFWQSFDHPTNNLFQGAKLGRDKLTGLNRRLVSRKNSVDQAPGAFTLEIDPTGAPQFILKELSSGVPYWSSGEWKGQYFNFVPEMRGQTKFVNNGQEEYFQYYVGDDAVVMHFLLETYGQLKVFVWVEALQNWTIAFSQPRSQCDVYAICGPFTTCDDNGIPFCKCMKGFTIRSLKDWNLDDRTAGCTRITPLDCRNNKSVHSTDLFYSIPCSRLPYDAQTIDVATSEGECAQACLNNCSCSAYSYGNNGCNIWHNQLVNVKQIQNTDNSYSGVQILNLRLAAKQVQNGGKNIRTILIVVVASASSSLFGLVLIVVMIWRNRKTRSREMLNNVQGGNGIVAFRYIDLQRATKNFSGKLGSGGFGSVFKGVLPDSTIIAVKMLEGVRQGEKQFRAEVSSIGMIQHINLVKLIGFCCESNMWLLVYEYMPNHSLDGHLFDSNITPLNWHTRYQIAVGIARGLAYLHESCRDSIIHCDIKPQNILLDASFIPKIADFGMAKLLKRDFSRVLTSVRGTIGYLAPEWISGMAVSTKVDVYSYGMVLLEIISGRRNSSDDCTSGDKVVYFPLHVAHSLLKGDVQCLVDQRLSNANLKEVERACKVACWCIQDEEYDRPTMGEVIQILEGVGVVDMPPLPRLLQAIAGNPPWTHSPCL